MGFILDAVFTLLAARAIWKLVQGVMQGMSGPPRHPRQARESSGVPAQGVQMARDPVCGTYVVPARAVVLAEGARRVYFCSAACRICSQRSRNRRASSFDQPSWSSNSGFSLAN